MAIDRARSARGALAGVIAAGVWALQQPLDQRVFGVAYDDTELLGKAVTRGRAWPAVGLALHLVNGAVFGAVYAGASPSLPLPAWARGPAAGMAEHLGTWPLIGVVERIHPAAADLPALSGDARAFAQATWRHLLFGFVLGEIERRVNRESGEDDFDDIVASNGHGNIEHAIIGVQG